MPTSDERWVPKVHPLDRQTEPEDPFELMAQPIDGDPAVMLECILQEFIWMGWDEPALVALVGNPAYPVLNALRDHYGEAEVRRHVHELVGRTGVWRFREEIAPCEEDIEPELVSISLPPSLCGGEKMGPAPSADQNFAQVELAGEAPVPIFSPPLSCAQHAESSTTARRELDSIKLEPERD